MPGSTGTRLEVRLRRADPRVLADLELRFALLAIDVELRAVRAPGGGRYGRDLCCAGLAARLRKDFGVLTGLVIGERARKCRLAAVDDDLRLDRKRERAATRHTARDGDRAAELVALHVRVGVTECAGASERAATTLRRLQHKRRRCATHACRVLEAHLVSNLVAIGELNRVTDSNRRCVRNVAVRRDRHRHRLRCGHPRDRQQRGRTQKDYNLSHRLTLLDSFCVSTQEDADNRPELRSAQVSIL